MTITRGVVLALGGLAALAGCRELELPPPPGPGTVQAVVVYAHPGQYDLVPAVGARARLLRGTEAAVVEDPEGRLVLGGLGHAPPPLLITFDSDADGVDDRQRLVNLAAAGAGFGRDVFLGTLALNRNAEVTGKVKRGDRAQLAGGHGGISLYVPEAPFATTSADDGTYRLSALPEGELTIAAFVEGYEPFAQTIALRGGERLSLADIELKPNPGAPTVGALSGSAYLTDGAPAAGVTVTASQTAEAPPVVTDAQGAFSFPALTVGLWNVRFERTGLATLRVDNVLVVGGQNVLPPVVL
ncbi:MAG: carboxypeptidase regulatory-like domain-containing protein, partial [Myxococcota bacterium]